MRKRSYVFTGFIAASAYVAIAGCGDDDVEEPLSEATFDAAPESAAVDTSVPDTFIPDVTTDRGRELTGQSCMVVADCYSDLDASSLRGEAKCLDKVTNGYCTHLCTVDADCCATPGECRTGLKQVCAPFESMGDKYCFVSCEPEDIEAAEDAGIDGGASSNDFCAREASPEFGCRSTGGGSSNRKVCLPTGGPSDGGSDAADAANDG